METRGEVPEESEELESNRIVVGLCGMIDPSREEVVGASQECREAGSRPVMITGDHLDTAVAIGKQLGIITDASQAITGMELDELSDEELNEKSNSTPYTREFSRSIRSASWMHGSPRARWFP